MVWEKFGVGAVNESCHGERHEFLRKNVRTLETSYKMQNMFCHNMKDLVCEMKKIIFSK